MAKMDLKGSASAVAGAKFSYSEITSFGSFLNQYARFGSFKFMNASDTNKILNAIEDEKKQLIDTGKQLRELKNQVIAMKNYLVGAKVKLEKVEIDGTNYPEDMQEKINDLKNLEDCIDMVLKSLSNCK